MEAVKQKLDEATIEYTLQEDKEVLTFRHWIDRLCHSSNFRLYYNHLLKEVPFPAYFWELPPISQNRLTEKFKFVVKDSPFLASVTPTPGTFAEHFTADQQVAVFPNLGGDAQLIAPAEIATGVDYAHLGKFVRRAPKQQVDRFWQIVGRIYDESIGAHPKWLSTNGMGVFWLHVRIDTRPKYYQYTPYKTF